MEALSPTMEEGRLISWLKKEGEAVAEGDVLAEVETDKATMELVARGSGVMRKQLLGDGETANVGTLIAVVAAEDEDISGILQEAGGADQAAEEAPAEEQQVAKAGEAGAAVAASGQTGAHQAQRSTAREAAAETATPTGDGVGGEGRLRASPVARRLAAESGLDLGEVRGTGPGGRIIKRDIEAALE